MRQRDPRARFAPRSPSPTVVATIIMAIVMIGIPGRVLRTTAVAAVGRAGHWLDRLSTHLCAPAERPALPPVTVMALAPDPPSPRSTLRRSAVSERPAAQAPRWLPSAGFPGVDFPIVNAADQAVPTARGGLGSHTPRSGLQEGAWARRARLFNDLEGLWAPFGVPFLFDGVASLENRAGSLENREQVAGIAGVFPRASLENRPGRPRVLQRTVESGQKFSREPSKSPGNSLEKRRFQPLAAAVPDAVLSRRAPV